MKMFESLGTLGMTEYKKANTVKKILQEKVPAAHDHGKSYFPSRLTDCWKSAIISQCKEQNEKIVQLLILRIAFAVS